LASGTAKLSIVAELVESTFSSGKTEGVGVLAIAANAGVEKCKKRKHNIKTNRIFLQRNKVTSYFNTQSFARNFSNS
jgi:hypothetical protein